MERLNRPSELWERIRALDESNKRCCDCGSRHNVDWVSINLLCVVCIQCSGVHRSLGSHISKVRSLNMDDLHSNRELKYLLVNHLINRNVNSVYEARIPAGIKITKDAQPADRARYIVDKYMHKKYVERTMQATLTNSQMANDKDIRDTEIEDLVRHIRAKSILGLQRSLAMSKHTLKDLCLHYGIRSPTLFQLSLEQFEATSSGTLVYYISEYLLLNGLLIDDQRAVGKTKLDVSPGALEYWTSRQNMYDTYANAMMQNNGETNGGSNGLARDRTKNGRMSNGLPRRANTQNDGKRRLYLDTQSSAFDNNRSSGPFSATSNKKRWSLASPTSILSIHKSLSRRDSHKKS
ncbi:ADP-ribosylation factor GTPase-activating protein effector protein 1 [Nakaseomyces glabratus]|uniref:ADP-ribosylation factor GTPase-activating protein n=1 Tax=Candida glabrata TaxID=5478 RepID=A0A0W0CHF7_CANGB|nr:ADP-ribosylation factor GTPase-activating protein effector protein 1 [Nakaseomyces glabratus]KTA98997.1 ADP-ribosylation factor GTPase-activating protein effector protein 1 [Nakaseomyces glabratus]